MGKYATDVDQFKRPPRRRFLVCFGSLFPSASPSFAFSRFSREFGSPAVGRFSLSHPITILRITDLVVFFVSELALHGHSPLSAMIADTHPNETR
jgi:hypothetical protein